MNTTIPAEIIAGVANGNVIHRQVGALPEHMLVDIVAQFLEVASKKPTLA